MRQQASINQVKTNHERQVQTNKGCPASLKHAHLVSFPNVDTYFPCLTTEQISYLSLNCRKLPFRELNLAIHTIQPNNLEEGGFQRLWNRKTISSTRLITIVLCISKISFSESTRFLVSVWIRTHIYLTTLNYYKLIWLWLAQHPHDPLLYKWFQETQGMALKWRMQLPSAWKKLISRKEQSRQAGQLESWHWVLFLGSKGNLTLLLVHGS